MGNLALALAFSFTLGVLAGIYLSPMREEPFNPNDYELPDEALNKEKLCERADAWDKSMKYKVGYAYYCGKGGADKDHEIAECLLDKARNTDKANGILRDISFKQSLGTSHPDDTWKTYCPDKESQQIKEE